MKRAIVTLIAAVALALPLGGSALAAQEADPNAVKGDGQSDFLAPVSPTITETTIHSNYTSNTDACASCHSTHTATGAKLLQWADVSTACWSCHDGTVTTTYNVQQGLIASTGARTSGGLFGVNGNEDPAASLSNHGVKANLKTGAAPGGANQEADDQRGTWSAEFTCASCHTPHGQGGNSRVLNPDPNGYAVKNATTNDILTRDGTNSALFRATGGDWLKGYPYSKRTAVAVDSNSNGITGWTWDEAQFKLVANDSADTFLKEGTDFTADYRKGEVTLTSTGLSKVGTSQVYAAYVRALVVRMTVQNKLQPNEQVLYESGLNKFCGACHTDYNTETVTKSGANLNGTYREAFRHKVGMTWSNTSNGLKYEFNTAAGGYKTVVCLTCHLAHGTDQTLMGGSETSGSSALKRMPNMGACESCHSKGAASNY